MAKLNINLLPPELEVEKKQKSRRTLIATISIGFLIVVIAIAAVVLTLRLSQSVILGQVNKDLEASKAKVSSPELKKKEGVVVSLKGRLDNIHSLILKETFSSYAFGLLNNLIPPEVELGSVTIDNKGSIRASIQTANINAIDTLFNNLVDPQTNQNKITGITIANFNRVQGSNYQVNMEITLVGAPSAQKAAVAPPPAVKK